MSFLNKLFSSKDKNSQEKKNIEEEIPDDFSNVKTRDQYKDYYFFYNYFKNCTLACIPCPAGLLYSLFDILFSSFIY